MLNFKAHVKIFVKIFLQVGTSYLHNNIYIMFERLKTFLTKKQVTHFHGFKITSKPDTRDINIIYTYILMSPYESFHVITHSHITLQ